MSVEYDNFKEQVRSAADIVEVISSSVALKKKGNKYWGCCPFHGEKTPSFAVDMEKGLFYCFGCHEGGDVFKFVMKSENCDFREALKVLAEKYNIPIPESRRTAQEIEKEKKSKEIASVNDIASKYFHACLTKTAYGKAALDYLHKRGINDAIIEQFSIGYALNSFTGLLHNLSRRKIAPQLLIDAGLVLPGKSQRLYDKFRDRVMIPIKDARGKVVGFGGRIIAKGEPKYLNTGETPWFNKRNILFGYDIAVKEIKTQKVAVVVEGYMDAISLHAVGISNVVASMGTAFAQEQAKLLRRTCEEIVFCYDSDRAGRTASMRAVGIASKEGLRVRIAGVPDGKDPDEFVRQHGKEAFLQVLDQAPEGIDFLIEETIKQNNITDFAGKARVVSNIVPFLLECHSEIEAAGYISKIAQRLTIDEGLISGEYHRAARQGRIYRQTPAVASETKVSSAQEQAERMLLSVILEHPELLGDCRAVLEEAGFAKKTYERVYKAFLDQYEQGVFDCNTLGDALDSEAISALAEILAYKVADTEIEKTFSDCLRIVKSNYLEREYARHEALALEYSKNQDQRLKDELLESQRLKNEIRKLYGN